MFVFSLVTNQQDINHQHEYLTPEAYTVNENPSNNLQLSQPSIDEIYDLDEFDITGFDISSLDLKNVNNRNLGSKPSIETVKSTVEKSDISSIKSEGTGHVMRDQISLKEIADNKIESRAKEKSNQIEDNINLISSFDAIEDRNIEMGFTLDDESSDTRRFKSKRGMIGQGNMGLNVEMGHNGYNGKNDQMGGSKSNNFQNFNNNSSN